MKINTFHIPLKTWVESLGVVYQPNIFTFTNHRHGVAPNGDLKGAAKARIREHLVGHINYKLSNSGVDISFTAVEGGQSKVIELTKLKG
jgi:hypothetical protein